MLSTAELTAMREAIAELLPGTCNILSPTLTSDGQGGQTITWGTATASAPCRLDPIRQREVVAGGELREYTSWRLTLVYDVTIDETNRVEVDSNTFAVTGIDQGGKSWSASKRVYLEAV